MVATVTFNPNVTTNASGSFGVDTEGYVQGTALNDPAVRYALSGGKLATSETLPMWGGVAIEELIPSGGNSLGGDIKRAVGLTTVTGFSVFDQNFAAVNTPQSPVPLAASGVQVNFYRMGSGARVAVACDPSLVSVEGDPITQQVAWDFTNQRLVPYLGTLTISSGTYDNTTGEVVLIMSAPITFGAGDSIEVSSLTGTGAFASLDGTFTAETGSTGTTVKYNAGAGKGAATITGGSLTVGGSASQALPVKVLGFNIGNSMTVAYDSATGFATWDRSGSAAIILI